MTIFLHWRNLKKEAAKNDILIMYIIYILNYAFLALEPQKIKIMTKGGRGGIILFPEKPPPSLCREIAYWTLTQQKKFQKKKNMRGP